jgi:hypothetical protein
LRIRSSPITPDARDCSAPGRAGTHPQHLLGPHPVGQRHPGRRSQPAGDHGVRVVGLAPAHHLDVQVADRGREHRRDLEPGREHERRPVGGQDQAGQPLQRQRVVAGQPAQVRAGGHQQSVDPGAGGGLLGV